LLIGDLGEGALIEELRAIFAVTEIDIDVGIGDDAAVISPSAGMRQVWTTDILIEDIHFNIGWQSPIELGRKCLAVNISDIAAMGARPTFALLSIGISPDTSSDVILDICRGISEAAMEKGIQVIGGDTSSSNMGIVISVAMAGEQEGGAVLRSGASVGEHVAVTGELGSAAAGLRLLQAGKGSEFPSLVDSFISPPDRVAVGVAAKSSGVSSMTDLSDGLASDLRSICVHSSVGAAIDLVRLPVSQELKAACKQFGWDMESLVLTGGEDYELLVTFPPDKADSMDRAASASGVELTTIGTIQAAAAGINMRDNNGSVRELPEHGYDHFRR
jgi:thiamine-monophosphate kinase